MSREWTESTGMPIPIALLGRCTAVLAASVFYDELLYRPESNLPDDVGLSLKYCIMLSCKASIGILIERCS